MRSIDPKIEVARDPSQKKPKQPSPAHQRRGLQTRHVPTTGQMKTDRASNVAQGPRAIGWPGWEQRPPRAPPVLLFSPAEQTPPGNYEVFELWDFGGQLEAGGLISKPHCLSLGVVLVRAGQVFFLSLGGENDYCGQFFMD